MVLSKPVGAYALVKFFHGSIGGTETSGTAPLQKRVKQGTLMDMVG
jgi:hypothetical protein